MGSEDSLLELRGVTKEFETAAGPLPILKGISLNLAAGDSLAIVGPSGCGKSTLLNIIGTLEKPTKGTVLLKTRNLAELPDKEVALVRNQEIGFVFQSHFLLPQCTVLENVLVPTIAQKSKPTGNADKIERARALLKRVGLDSRLNHFPGQLSGGEKQRVAVVRALINQPALLLADEPTGALDEQSAKRLAELLVELNSEQSVTLIVVTHALDLAAKMKQQKRLHDGLLQ